MDMDMQTAFNILIGISAFLIGWVLNNITKTIERLDSDVRHLPHTYVTKDDYRRDIDELKHICNAIFKKLDGKVDK